MTTEADRVGFLSLPLELRLQIVENVVDQGPNAGLVAVPTYRIGSPRNEPDCRHETSQERNQALEGLDGHQRALRRYRCIAERSYHINYPPYDSLYQRFRGLVLDPGHMQSTTDGMNLLLLCRQMRDECTQLVYRCTVFVMPLRRHFSPGTLRPLHRHQCENLRNVILAIEPRRFVDLVASWTRPFATDTCHLNRLTIAFTPLTGSGSQEDDVEEDDFALINTSKVVELLRRLEHVDRLRFVQNATCFRRDFYMCYNQIVGLLLKEDHYQRYDAPGAPHIEATWWNWNFNAAEQSFEFAARPAKPITPEPQYMEAVAPLVAKLMSEMETHQLLSSLRPALVHQHWRRLD